MTPTVGAVGSGEAGTHAAAGACVAPARAVGAGEAGTRTPAGACADATWTSVISNNNAVGNSRMQTIDVRLSIRATPAFRRAGRSQAVPNARGYTPCTSASATE